MHAMPTLPCTLLVLTLVGLLLPPATGRKGCLNYGHSCLGAHGKRSSGTTFQTRDDDSTEDELQRRTLEEAYPDLALSNYPQYDNSLNSNSRAERMSRSMDPVSLWKNLMLATRQLMDRQSEMEEKK